MAARQSSRAASGVNLAMQTPGDYQSCAERLKALADPDRLRIVNTLLGGEISVSALAAELDAPIDKVSHHLGVLRAARLVNTHKQGKFVIYSLAPEVAAGQERAAGIKTIDLGCCQLDLVLPELPAKDARTSVRTTAGKPGTRKPAAARR